MILGSKIFLIGMPGCGKSTLARDLAKSLQLEFVDLDEQIEESEGKKVGHIFDNKGEDFFRTVEKDQLDKCIYERSSFIMATGGGTPCFFDNMKGLISAGLVVFIDVSPAELYKRLIESEGVGKRPLLNKFNYDSIEEELMIKRVNRMQFYSQAHITVSGDSITSDEVKNAISTYAD